MKIREAFIAYRKVETVSPAKSLADAQSVAQYVADGIAQRPEQEQLWVVLLNAQLRPMGRHLCFVGTLDSVAGHPRELLRIIMLSGAHSFIVVHNHPSGDPSPSNADLEMTEHLRQASVLVGVPLLDHIVVGNVDDDPHGKGFRSLMNEA